MKEKLPLVAMNVSSDRTEREASSHKPFNENILRPKFLKDYIGQKPVASKLEVFMSATKARGMALDHVLLSGPPGLGKTTLAHIVASVMGGRLHLAPGPTVEKSADLLYILQDLQPGDVLFIDEIHRLNPAVEESLYPAMEDFQFQMLVGEGVSSQPITMDLSRFTLIGATTQPGKLTAPMRDRFGIHLNLDFYATDEMEQILSRSAKILNVDLTREQIKAVAARSRGTPRIGNRLLSRVRDFVEVAGSGQQLESLSVRARTEMGSVKTTSVEIVEMALEFLDVDARGLQPMDRRYLSSLIEQFKGGPAGVEALAATMSEDRSTLEETVEPYLLKEGFIVRTPRGRQATDAAYQHLGLPQTGSPSLL